MNKVFVYGTLRNGAAGTHVLSNYRMFLVQGKKFNFPFVQQTYGSYKVLGNIIEVDDEGLAKLDKYENVAVGLYTREKLRVQDRDTYELIEAWVYVGGPQLAYQPIDSGDWLSR